jgi:hypothetical protein
LDTLLEKKLNEMEAEELNAIANEASESAPSPAAPEALALAV